MVICIFGNTVVKPGMEEAEARLADKLAAILRKLPGFRGMHELKGIPGFWQLFAVKA